VTDKLIDRGIYRTTYGYRVIIRIGDKLDTKRFPPTYTVDALRKWRDDHIRLRRPKKTQRGTFRDDVRVYLNAVQHMPSYEDRKREIEAWCVGLAPTFTRWRLTPAMIRTQLAAWKAEGLAASTINHRRTALSHLYSVLDGKGQYNPVKEVPRLPEPPPVRRGVPMAVVVKVLKQMKRAPKTHARLEILAWTGLRPSELMRLTPDLVDLRRGIAIIPTAKKGPTREIPFRNAIPAWKRLVKLKALGKFSPQSARKQLHAACKRAKVPPFRVYDLRHSYLSALRRSGADLSDIQAIAGHSDIQLTRRYAPTITAKLQKAVRRLK
jgi:integrase